MSDKLLLPSAILVPDELRLDLGRIPTGMIPLHGKPVIQHIAESYEGVTTYVACHERRELIAEYIQREGLDWDLIDVPDTSSLGETILYSLDHILSDPSFENTDQLYINFADTLVAPNQLSGTSDFVSYDEKKNQVRWTTFEGEDQITSITRKGDPTASGTRRVFTGLFRFTDPENYRNTLVNALEREIESEPDPFYVALQEYLRDRSYDLIESEEWIDVGHLDTYHRAKKQFLNVREFNSLSVDTVQNTITKSTDKADTLHCEYQWYTTMPEDLRPFIPQIYDYNQDRAKLELEFIGYPSLRDIHLHGEHGLHIWNNIFNSIFDMLDSFSKYTTDDAVNSSLERMYVDKTKHRIEEIDSTGDLDVFFQNTIQINGSTYPGIPQILEDIETDLLESGLFDLNELHVIHGDPCFSNILFDVRSGVIKLIDPRGEFGPHTIYGDQRYDLAKLRHSVAGNYDFIINDMFNISIDDNVIDYNVFRRSVHDEREQLFDSLLKQKYQSWFENIKLIEGLLFLSMAPLHSDNTNRQQYMLSRGLELYNKWVGK